MSYFKGFDLNKYPFWEYETDSADIEPFNKINLFIGENNSGKSRLMRNLPLFLQEKQNNSYILEHTYYDELKLQILQFVKSSKNQVIAKFIFFESNNISYDSHHKENCLNSFSAVINNINKKSIAKMSNTFSGLSGYLKTTFNSSYNSQYMVFNVLVERLIDQAKDFDNQLKINCLYSPILRGLRPLDSQTDLYAERTTSDYFDSHINNIEIVTGFSFYSDFKNHLLGDIEDRNRVNDFEKFLSKNFFDEKEIAIIPKFNSDVLNIKIDDEERAIHELGDGIQSIILLTFKLFMEKGPRVFLFEEPEIYMHPGLQRKFLESLFDERFKNFQFFFTTHSNHFLDLTLEYDEINMYSFSKLVEKNSLPELQYGFKINYIDSNYIDVLNNLGVRSSSVLLSNCSIWVEGITDRLYLKHYLKLYIEKNNLHAYTEDLHYTFIEYGGNNIVHWDFSSETNEDDTMNPFSMSKNIFLITDRDDTIEDGLDKKSERIRELRTLLGEDNFECLKVRVIENLLTPEQIKKTLHNYYKKDYTYDFKELNANYDSLKYEHSMGYILRNNVVNINKGIYKDSNSDLSDKRKFCKSAIKDMTDYDNLSDDAKALTEKIYKFIVTSNK